MENYPKRFIQAGLIYILMGVLLGVAMSIDPTLNARMRFVHIHVNLLGFMTMMIAGVAYHVLPRFSARTIPWPNGMKYHFYLQNIGLVGMVSTHAAGGNWKEGALHWLFVLFALITALALVFMFYNLFFVLMAPKEEPEPVKQITGDMKVGAVLDEFPQSMAVFLESGFDSLANPAARKTFAKYVSIEKACEKHNVDMAEFLIKLNAAVFGSSTSPTMPESSNKGEEAENKNPGKEIFQGETCKAETMVGSLIKVYPATKSVFEKHYGEGCFSCPGQTFESVEETAQMHNIDPKIVLDEINAIIEEGLKK
ncbi:MAG: DUF1858 domain-containing protein [Nitrospinaceae bacterium]|nr:DUF1858 domain-containing protein [Nitrospinaceae bacterium]MDP6711077.1 DUF1858 domain-containing protein [Nitrospinaceae bacterium]MDP7056781.1 DUF1858 domain-containing protein [Nitrospinaceae bacterium]